MTPESPPVAHRTWPGLLLAGVGFAIIIALLIAAARSCTRATEQAADAPPSQPAEPPPPVTIPEDRSLPAKDYAAQGMPDPGTAWAGSDYAEAVRCLAVLGVGDVCQLPRLDSPRSGTLFARMIADDNIAPLRDPARPVADRLSLAGDLMIHLNRLAILYIQASNRGQGVFDAEIVELLALSFRTTVAIFPVLHQFMPTLDPSDPTYPARMDGLRQTRTGLVRMVEGALQTLSEKQYYRLPVLVTFAGHLERALPALMPELPPETQAETKQRLTRLAREEADPDLRAALARLEKAVAGGGPQ